MDADCDGLTVAFPNQFHSPTNIYSSHITHTNFCPGRSNIFFIKVLLTPKSQLNMKVFIALANLIAFASASTFVAFSENNFSGLTNTVGACGCTPIFYHGSYQWTPTGGDGGRVYSGLGCQGPAVIVLPPDSPASQGTSFTGDSILIIC